MKFYEDYYNYRNIITSIHINSSKEDFDSKTRVRVYYSNLWQEHNMTTFHLTNQLTNNLTNPFRGLTRVRKHFNSCVYRASCRLVAFKHN